MGLRQWALAVKPHVVEADLEKMHCTTQKAVAQFVMAVVMYMFNCREAVWWISHRNESPSTWFQPSTKACVEYFSKKNHFK